MKTRFIVVTAAIAVFGATSVAALAADDKAANAKPDAQTATQNADAAQPPAKAKKKPPQHSHTQEKHGGSASATSTETVAADAKKEAKDPSKLHLHARDAK
jgi:hypothetical protein